jgi:uncharacterized protein (DUF1697 family)
MTTYISILRGINVGGAKKILMNDLKEIYEGLGFREVITYIQSGNVIFQSGDFISNELAAETIRNAIFKKYGYEVPVLMRTVEEMQNTLKNNPFPKNKNNNPEKMHVTLLAELPEQQQLEKIRKYDYSPDRFEIIGKDVFLYCPNGYGTTKLSNSFFESRLKVSATTRNWKTVNALVEIATGQPQGNS